MIGNYIESIERGADTIVITGSCGPCRFGFYGLMQEDILRGLGYDVDIIVIDALREGHRDFIKNVRKVTKANNIFDIYRSAKLALKLIKRADNLTQKFNYTRAYAVDKDKVNGIMDDYLDKAVKVHGASELIELIDKTEGILSAVKLHKDYDPIKIGIIGEIYTIIEPFANFEVERRLGELGVLVEKSLTPTRWLEQHVINYPFGSKDENLKYKLAKPYLETPVGGHGRETIGSAIHYKNRGYDGAIQILPLNCMPEIVAKSILKNVSRDLDFPIMTLVVDEMTGEAGYVTRLEAFVDLVSKRREKRSIG